MSNDIIRVVQPVLYGTQWLAVHWPFVLLCCAIAAAVMFGIYRYWTTTAQRGQALFHFTLAEQMRVGGRDLTGAIALYDQILTTHAQAASEHLLWRAYFGRARALFALGQNQNAKQALDQAIRLAEKAAAKQKQQQKPNKPAKPDAVSSSAAALDDPDVDPFLHAPIPMAELHYLRGRLYDAANESTAANESYAEAMRLDPDRSFVEGYVARRQFDERLASGAAAATVEGETQPTKRRAQPKH